MDNYRGHFADHASGYDPLDCDADSDYPSRPYAEDDAIDREPPPSPVGQDERRMQVRAYNLWASLLGNRAFPSVADLKAAQMPELAPYSVMLNFEDGIENPGVTMLGEKIAAECGAEQTIRYLSDIPGRSLLSRITDHYMQILANEAPIGFEAEFVNQRGKTIAYRGILLPFSSNGETIQHILGIINWKELADQATTAALNVEVERALAQASVPARKGEALAAWADGPVDIDSASSDPAILDLGIDAIAFPSLDLPAPTFGPDLGNAPFPGYEDEPRDLAGWLASARALADAAHGSEDRTRVALYAAIGRAWDFALAAAAAPAEFAALVAEAGLSVQERAPLTPVVKLVFGAGYDKTRLTEYATALAYAQRLRLARGALADHLALVPGGLKGVVQDERRLKRAASGRADSERTGPGERLARKLRRMAPHPLESVARTGGEFTVLLARRLESGEVVLLGEVGDDASLIERTARRLLA